MFQTLSNSGRQAELSTLRSVVSVEGDVIYRSLPKAQQKVPQQAAWLTTFAMKKGLQKGLAATLIASLRGLPLRVKRAPVMTLVIAGLWVSMGAK